MTAEQFTSEFYKLWFNHRIEFGLASFHESADILIAAFDKEHGIGAARKPSQMRPHWLIAQMQSKPWHGCMHWEQITRNLSCGQLRVRSI